MLPANKQFNYFKLQNERTNVVKSKNGEISGNRRSSSSPQKDEILIDISPSTETRPVTTNRNKKSFHVVPSISILDLPIDEGTSS